jgi:hypothetical protein
MVKMRRRAHYDNYNNNPIYNALFRTNVSSKVIFIGVVVILAFSFSTTSTMLRRKQHTATATKRRLEFVHITKTGGSAIEKAGAQHGLIWGACHYMNITDVGCFNPDLPYVAPNYQSYVKTSPWHTPPKIIKTQHNINNSNNHKGDSGGVENPYIGADLFAVIRNPYDRVLSEYYCPWLGFQPRFRKNTKQVKDPNDPEIMNDWVKKMVTKLENSLNEYKTKSNKAVEQGKGLNEDPEILAQKHYVNQAEYVFDGDVQVIKNIVYYENLSNDFETLMKDYGLDGLKLPSKGSGGTYTNNNKKLTYRDLDEGSIAIINRYAAKDFEMFGYQMTNKFDPDVKYSLKAKKIKNKL